MRNNRRNSVLVSAVVSALALLTGCASTPSSLQSGSQLMLDRVPPAKYSEVTQVTQADTKPRATESNKNETLARWWERFGDPVLNDFVNQAIAQNDDVAIAIAKVEQARAVSARSASDMLPTLDVGGSVTRQRQSLRDNQNSSARNQPGFSRESTTYRADTNISWEADIFGRLSSLRDANQARAEASQADADAAKLTAIGEVARNVINARALQQRIKLAEEAAAIETELVDVTRAKARGGQVSQGDVLRAVALEQNSLADAARLKSDYASSVQALAILLATTPENIRDKLKTPGQASPVLAIAEAGLPADLLRRRPDIRRAEFQLEAASKDIAATQAERYPKLNLGATLALIAGTFSGLRTADALFGSIAPSVTWRALDFGKLDADIARAKGIEKEALIRYRQTVTVAFAEADTALGDLARRETTYRFTLASVNAQRDAWEIVKLQYERGLSDFAAALDAKRALTQSQDAAAVAAQSQLLAGVTAYRALGGGW
jgi:NodT family efflux transporter outer membrane factor (OMF) lipoprotein